MASWLCRMRRQTHNKDFDSQTPPTMIHRQAWPWRPPRERSLYGPLHHQNDNSQFTRKPCKTTRTCTVYERLPSMLYQVDQVVDLDPGFYLYTGYSIQKSQIGWCMGHGMMQSYMHHVHAMPAARLKVDWSISCWARSRALSKNADFFLPNEQPPNPPQTNIVRLKKCR